MSGGFYYMATPYSKFSKGRDEAHRLACLAAAECLRLGILVFSPIAHGHAIAQYGNFETDYETWKQHSEAMMRAADGLIVIRMEGWKESDGVTEEIKWFKESGKPILQRDPPQ